MIGKKRKTAAILLFCLALAGCGPAQGTAPDSGEGSGGQSVSGEGAGLEEENPAEAGGLMAGTGTGGNLSESSAERAGTDGNPPESDVAEQDAAGDASDTAEDSADSAKAETSQDAAATEEPPESGYDFTMCFAGDINLDENWCTTQFLSAQPNGIYDCISQELMEAMQEADIMCLNNEFTYSTGGSPLAGKAYTFRADPGRVEVLGQMGVDTVTLANNHVYDYGKEALLDTFQVLEEAGIPYFGAGRTLEEARKPLYLEADGKTVALVAASRAEKNKMTPQAT